MPKLFEEVEEIQFNEEDELDIEEQLSGSEDDDDDEDDEEDDEEDDDD